MTGCKNSMFESVSKACLISPSTPYPLLAYANLGQHNVSGCEECSPGQYCGSPGQASPSGDCDPGWYCTLGSSLPTPTAPQGGKCLAGNGFCQTGHFNNSLGTVLIGFCIASTVLEHNKSRYAHHAHLIMQRPLMSR